MNLIERCKAMYFDRISNDMMIDPWIVEILCDLIDYCPIFEHPEQTRTEQWAVRLSRTEHLRTSACSVRIEHEQNKPNKLEPALFGKPSLKSMRDRCPSTEQVALNSLKEFK